MVNRPKSACQERLEARSAKLPLSSTASRIDWHDESWKVETARKRRRDRLLQLQHSCRQRAERTRYVVESTKRQHQRLQFEKKRFLEEQLQSASARRQQQTDAMVARLAERWQSVDAVRSKVQTAKFIQRWFRRHLDARVLSSELSCVKKEVRKVTSCMGRLATCDNFDAGMRLLQEKALSRAALQVFNVLQAPDKHSAIPSCFNSAPKKNADKKLKMNKSATSKVLLMAGMVSNFPAQILEHERCQPLEWAAKRVCLDLEQLSQEVDSASPRQLKALVSALKARFSFYCEMFADWKQRDAERLAKELLTTYEQVFRSKIQYDDADATHEEDGMHELRRQTQKQLAQLRQALAQVLGKDATLLRVREVERSVHKKLAGAHESEPEAEIEEPKVTQRLEEPPSQVASLLSDEKLVHELILNPEFKVPEAHSSNSEGSLESRVRDSMMQAFWDQVVQERDSKTLVARLGELRQQFASVLPMQKRLVEEVNAALVADELEALVNGGMDAYAALKHKCVRVLLVILQAEAPARNATTKEFISSFERGFAALEQADLLTPDEVEQKAVRLLVDFVAFAFRQLENLRVDMLNAHLGMLAAYLERSGVPYVQRKVQEQIASGALRLDATEKWLTSEMDVYWTTLDAGEKERLARFEATAFSRFLQSAFVSLVTKYTETSVAGMWPETYRLDGERIRETRDALDRVAVVSSLVAKLQEYLLGRHVRVTKSLLNRVGYDLNTLLESPGVAGSQLTAQVVQEARRLTEDVEEAKVKELEESLPYCFDKSNAVFQLFFRRVVQCLQDGLAGRGDLHASLSPFEGELKKMVKQIQKLETLNENVYATQYSRIVKALVTSKYR